MEHLVTFVDHVQGSSTMAQWKCSCGEQWVSNKVLPCPKTATLKTCPHCAGHGYNHFSGVQLVKCMACDGTGEIHTY